MIGEVSIGGVYLPVLLLLGLIALGLTGLLSRLLAVIGFYRLVAYRPLVDLAIFMLILGSLAYFTTPPGYHP